MKKLLNSEQQINKLQEATALAQNASKSSDVTTRLGAFVLNAGMVDFCVIQAARLVEQIILKAQMAEGKTPSFQPSPDEYFYDKKKSTGGILKGIRKLLPFSSADTQKAEEVKRINELANKMIDIGFQFLNCRNPIVHHIGNPKKELKELIKLCDQANENYDKFCAAHTEFMTAAQPYRFSETELRHFYGNSTNTTIE